MTRRCSVAAAVALAVAQRCPAAQERASRSFRRSVQLVEVYATVTDAKGEPVTGLRAGRFRGLRGQPAAGGVDLRGRRVPADRGARRRSQLEHGRRPAAPRQAGVAVVPARAASRTIARWSSPSAARPTSSRRCPWIGSTQARAIDALDPWSTTALHDAIIATLDRLEPEPGRQALDRVFRRRRSLQQGDAPREVVERARRSNALIYPIAFGRERPPLLAELAVVTGGRSFLLRDVRELEKTLADDRPRAALPVSARLHARASRSSAACGNGDRFA